MPELVPPKTSSSDQATQHAKFAAPDEVRQFPHGEATIVRVGGGEVGRLTFQPGWKWSTDVRPIAKTESCEAPHFQYHVAGRLAVRMDDGTEFVAGPGDVTSLPRGHDAWVVGDEPVVVVDWYGASRYAKPGGPGGADGAALRSFEAENAALYEGSADAVYVYLDDQNKSCNARFAKLLGYGSPAEWAAVDAPFADAFVEPASRPVLVGAYHAAIQHGVGATIRVGWKRKDGAVVPTDVILVPVEHRGERMALHFVRGVRPGA